MESQIQLTPLLIIYAACIAIVFGLATYTYRRQRDGNFDKKTLTFLGLLFGLGFWNLGRFFEYLLVDPTLVRYAITIVWIGYGAAGVSLLFFGIAFTGRTHLITLHTVSAFFLLHLIMVGLAFTNDYHSLLWTGEFIATSGWYGDDLVVYDRAFQPLFHIYLAYIVTCCVIGVILLIQISLISPQVYQVQSTALIVGSGIALYFGVAYGTESQLFVPAFIDLTPVGFAMASILYYFAMFEYEAIDISPIASDAILKNMDEGVLVLDDERRITNANPMILDLFGLEKIPIGESLSAFLSDYPDVEEAINEQLEQFAGTGTTESNLTSNGDIQSSEDVSTNDVQIDSKYLSVTSSPLRETGGSAFGAVVLFSDITERRLREQELREREAELDLLRQVQSRVLRHNIRNDLSVVKLHNEVFAEEFDDEHADRAETVVSTAEDLITVSNKARVIETLTETDQQPTQIDLRSIIEEHYNTYQKRFPEVTFELQAPSESTVKTIPAINQTIKNLIENAAEHNDAPTPTVTIQLRETADKTVLRIADNGPGIPQHELNVLEDRQETDLQHGSGVGLWIVDWYVRNSNASVGFDSGSNGSTVIITIPNSESNGRGESCGADSHDGN